MASVVQRTRTDGGSSFQVRWRLGGTRKGPVQTETFARGTDEANRSRAQDFARMVEHADHQWPTGWVKGRGFTYAAETTGHTPLLDYGLAYVDQLLDVSPGQRKRYKAQIRKLADFEIDGRQPLAILEDVTEADVRAWSNAFPYGMKTRANYHGLLFALFADAQKRGLRTDNPCSKTAPKRSKVKASQAEQTYLSQEQFARLVALCPYPEVADMMTVAVGTGLRYGEITALWVEDVDPHRSTLRVRKAWKRDGEDGDQNTPSWLKRRIKPKHQMRNNHLGEPKSVRSKRTLRVSETVLSILVKRSAGKDPDDFLFTTATGRPMHSSEFSDQRWTPLMALGKTAGLPYLRFHDLRHTHVAWLIDGGVPLPHIQARVGHESISTTIDEYGHLLPGSDAQIVDVVESALSTDAPESETGA